MADRVERIRRHLVGDRVYANQASAWVFAGVLLLPAGWAGVLIIGAYAHTVVIGWRQHLVRPHRSIFGCSTAVLGAFAANAIIHAISPSGAMGSSLLAAIATLAALLAFTGVGLAVMLGGVLLATRPQWIRGVLPGRGQVFFELLTLILGVVTAQLITHNPWLTPIVVVLVAAVHRASLVAQLEVAARTDARTGLLNPAAWQRAAEQQVERAGREHLPAALLLIDLDRFKAINDTHGHLAGDRALRAVADCLMRELRGYDAVGRYGGEEFAALLPGVGPAQGGLVAERLRAAIAALPHQDGVRVTASIGVAVHPQDGRDLTALVEAADRALYAAKSAGRNRIGLAAA